MFLEGGKEESKAPVKCFNLKVLELFHKLNHSGEKRTNFFKEHSFSNLLLDFIYFEYEF